MRILYRTISTCSQALPDRQLARLKRQARQLLRQHSICRAWVVYIARMEACRDCMSNCPLTRDTQSYFATVKNRAVCCAYGQNNCYAQNCRLGSPARRPICAAIIGVAPISSIKLVFFQATPGTASPTFTLKSLISHLAFELVNRVLSIATLVPKDDGP